MSVAESCGLQGLDRILRIEAVASLKRPMWVVDRTLGSQTELSSNLTLATY